VVDVVVDSTVEGLETVDVEGEVEAAVPEFVVDFAGIAPRKTGSESACATKLCALLPLFAKHKVEHESATTHTKTNLFMRPLTT
jgi:hypothetical protein